MPHFDVFYQRPEFFRDGVLGYNWLAKQNKLPRPGALDETHVYLMMREATDLENLFHEMQAEQWSSSRDDMSTALKALAEHRVSHTSMTGGDIAVDESGGVWLVDVLGWRGLSREPDSHVMEACRVFGVLPEQVTPEMRDKAKALRYARMYGATRTEED